MLELLSAGPGAVPDSAQWFSLVPPDVIQATRSPAPADVFTVATDALFTPQIDAFIRDTLDFWNLTGASVAIVRKRANSSLTSVTFDVETRGYGSAGEGREMTAEVRPRFA